MASTLTPGIDELMSHGTGYGNERWGDNWGSPLAVFNILSVTSEPMLDVLLVKSGATTVCESIQVEPMMSVILVKNNEAL